MVATLFVLFLLRQEKNSKDSKRRFAIYHFVLNGLFTRTPVFFAKKRLFRKLSVSYQENLAQESKFIYEKYLRLLTGLEQPILHFVCT